jgi:DNA-binding transcriptional MerR regulator
MQDTDDSSAGPPLPVGELARRTGLTVRALHHYDEVGLLVPSARTPSGHRRYAAADVRRLARIVALRGLGLGLAEIRAALDGGPRDAMAAIRERLDVLERELAETRRLRDRLARILDGVGARDDVPPSTDDLIDAIEVMTMLEEHWGPEAMGRIAARREALGEDAIREVEEAWPVLFADVRSAMDEGVDPADPRAQALGRRWRELVEAFTGGDPEIASGLARLYREQDPATLTRSADVDPALWAYVERIHAAAS